MVLGIITMGKDGGIGCSKQSFSNESNVRRFVIDKQLL